MQVILLQDLYKHGVAGEVVKVADGFARNYLIPRKMAVQATGSAMRQTAAIRENVEARKAQYNNMLNDLAHQIDGVELIFGRRAASTGKLFGSVTTQEIADELDKVTSVDINRRRISQQSLREVGTHLVPVRLGTEIAPTLKVTIVPEDDLLEFLAARERGEMVSAEDIMVDGFRYATSAADDSEQSAEEAADEQNAEAADANIAEADAELEIEAVEE
ncbi:MAG: 50S ribosomal protein L9 [Chloroflexota bacterium]|nr:50S ribosomal protein L9 [Chloroflexota bacterium]MDE2908194.1 50S ribosomal protein L9 [Chloroflexota bacterium]